MEKDIIDIIAELCDLDRDAAQEYYGELCLLGFSGIDIEETFIKLWEEKHGLKRTN